MELLLRLVIPWVLIRINLPQISVFGVVIEDLGIHILSIPRRVELTSIVLGAHLECLIIKLHSAFRFLILEVKGQWVLEMLATSKRLHLRVLEANWLVQESHLLLFLSLHPDCLFFLLLLLLNLRSSILLGLLLGAQHLYSSIWHWS